MVQTSRELVQLRVSELFCSCKTSVAYVETTATVATNKDTKATAILTATITPICAKVTRTPATRRQRVCTLLYTSTLPSNRKHAGARHGGTHGAGSE